MMEELEDRYMRKEMLAETFKKDRKGFIIDALAVLYSDLVFSRTEVEMAIILNIIDEVKRIPPTSKERGGEK